VLVLKPRAVLIVFALPIKPDQAKYEARLFSSEIPQTVEVKHVEASRDFFTDCATSCWCVSMFRRVIKYVS